MNRLINRKKVSTIKTNTKSDDDNLKDIEKSDVVLKETQAVFPGINIDSFPFKFEQYKKKGKKKKKKMNKQKEETEETKPNTITTNPYRKSSVFEGFGSVALVDDDEDLVVYERNCKTRATTSGRGSLVESYDQDLCPGRYNGPQIAASTMAKHYPNLQDRETVQIIDVGAGTGRVGFELANLGFKLIDAIEPSGGMLQLLEQRGIYRNTYKQFIGVEPIQGIEQNTYDALVISGCMGEGHIPTFALHEMLRIVKPSGYIFIIMREEYLSVHHEYFDKLKAEMKQLEEVELWKQVNCSTVPNYSYEKNGIVYVYMVTKGC